MRGPAAMLAQDQHPDAQRRDTADDMEGESREVGTTQTRPDPVMPPGVPGNPGQHRFNFGEAAVGDGRTAFPLMPTVGRVEVSLDEAVEAPFHSSAPQPGLQLRPRKGGRGVAGQPLVAVQCLRQDFIRVFPHGGE